MTVVVHGWVQSVGGGTVTGGHDVEAVQVPGTVVVMSGGVVPGGVVPGGVVPGGG